MKIEFFDENTSINILFVESIWCYDYCIFCLAKGDMFPY